LVICAFMMCPNVALADGDGEDGPNFSKNCNKVFCKPTLDAPGSGAAPNPSEVDPLVTVGDDTAQGAEAGDNASSDGPVCSEVPLDPQPAEGGPYWRGHTAAEGQIVRSVCSDGSPVAIIVPHFQAFGEAAQIQPPPPDPAVLAQQAIALLAVTPPTIGVGPNRNDLAVRLWTWLWVNDAPPVSVTVAAGGVSVTATATLSSTDWSLGEPTTTGDVYAPGPPATVTCSGAGRPPSINYDWKAEPPCGHIYVWRSLKERTGGTGKWPITATTNWTVTWQSNTGVTGTDTLTATATDEFDVAEYRIVLVQPGG
jgi:hypothetical protein